MSGSSTMWVGHGEAEQPALRDELKAILDTVTYDKLAEVDSSMQDAAEKVLSNVPTGIYVG